MGILGIKSTARTMAIVGVVLCIIGLVGSLAYTALGIYLNATGRHSYPLINFRHYQ